MFLPRIPIANVPMYMYNVEIEEACPVLDYYREAVEDDESQKLDHSSIFFFQLN